MPLTIDSPICGSTVNGLPLDVQWTESPAPVRYYVRIRSDPANTGSVYYTSGLLNGPLNNHVIQATNLPVGCSTQWLSINYDTGTEWLLEECQVEFCVDAPVVVADCNTSPNPLTPEAPSPLSISGCPVDGVLPSGSSIDLTTNIKQEFPPELVNETGSTDMGIEQLTWANDPSFIPAPCDEPSYQQQWLAGEFTSKLGYTVLTGVNRYARVCSWQKLPDFTRTNTTEGTQGSVIFFKWGIGLFPCRTVPTSGTSGVPANGQNGWSVRDQAYVSGYASQPTPAPGNANLHSYIYHTDMTGSFGESAATINGGSGPRYYTEVSLSEWVYVEKLVCLNDINVNNGYVKTWIDGALVEDIQGINFTNNPDLLSINRIGFTYYHGGNIPAPSDAVSYFADPKFVVGEAALIDPVWSSTPAVADQAPQCRDRYKSAALSDGNYTFSVNGVTCQFRVGEEVICLEPIVTPIDNGQSTITNPNNYPLTVTISSGSATFQNPIPANTTVNVTNVVGGDGVNAAGQAIKTFCITGNC